MFKQGKFCLREEGPDEKAARLAISDKVSGLSGWRYEPNGQYTYPDYIVSTESQGRVYIEVVLGVGLDAKKGDSKGTFKFVNRSLNPWYCQLAKKLQSDLVSSLKPTESVIICSSLWHGNSNQFAECLAERIIKELPNLRESVEKLEIPDLYTSVQLVEFYEGLPPVYVIDVSNLSQRTHIPLDTEALFILNSCIEKKRKKAKHSGLMLPIWLAIVSMHPLLRFEDYQEVFKLVPKETRCAFDKIFIIISYRAEQLYL